MRLRPTGGTRRPGSAGDPGGPGGVGGARGSSAGGPLKNSGGNTKPSERGANEGECKGGSSQMIYNSMLYIPIYSYCILINLLH